MGFPPNVKEQAAVACNRCCCICHEFKGPKLEFHHIKQQADGGDNSFENCIPLCFDCHADMGRTDPRHPKRNHYSERELRMHRDKWYRQCEAKETTFVEATDEDIDALFATTPEEKRNLQDNEHEKSQHQVVLPADGLMVFAERLAEALPTVSTDALVAGAEEIVKVLPKVTTSKQIPQRPAKRKKVIRNSDPFLSDKDEW